MSTARASALSLLLLSLAGCDREIVVDADPTADSAPPAPTLAPLVVKNVPPPAEERKSTWAQARETDRRLARLVQYVRGPGAIDPAYADIMRMSDDSYGRRTFYCRGKPASWIVSSSSLMRSEITMDGERGGASYTYPDKYKYQKESAGFVDLWGMDCDDIWAAGREIAHWDGKGWTAYPMPPGINGVAKIFGTAGDDIWATTRLTSAPQPRSDTPPPDPPQKVLHWDGASWTVHEIAGMRLIEDLFGFDKQNFWFVGYEAGSNFGAVASLKNAGGGAQKSFDVVVAAAQGGFRNVHGSDPNSLWATTHSEIWQRVDGRWIRHAATIWQAQYKKINKDGYVSYAPEDATWERLTRAPGFERVFVRGRDDVIVQAASYSGGAVFEGPNAVDPTLPASMIAKERATSTTLTLASVEPPKGKPGQQIVLSGTGFTADEKISVTFGGAVALVDGRTETELLLRVPVNAVDGDLQILVGTSSTSTPFTVGRKEPPPPPRTIAAPPGSRSVLLAIDPNVAQKPALALIKKSGAVVTAFDAKANAYEIAVPKAKAKSDADLERFIAKLKKDPRVLAADPR